MSFLCSKVSVRVSPSGCSTMNCPWVPPYGCNFPLAKVWKLTWVGKVVCTTFWYKPLSLSFHSIEIGGAVSVRSLAGRLFRYPCCSRSLSARLTAEWIFLICDDYGPTLLRSNASVCCLEHHGLHRLHASYPIEISSSPRAVILLILLDAFDIICTGT